VLEPSFTSQKLLLNNVTSFDAATYRCKVQYEFHRADSNEVSLQTTGASGNALIILPSK